MSSPKPKVNDYLRKLGLERSDHRIVPFYKQGVNPIADEYQGFKPREIEDSFLRGELKQQVKRLINEWYPKIWPIVHKPNDRPLLIAEGGESQITTSYWDVTADEAV